jgi:hypothetical protein
MYLSGIRMIGINSIAENKQYLNKDNISECVKLVRGA